MKSVTTAANRQPVTAESASAADTDLSEASSTEPAQKLQVAEGKITELLCGHPPSVMFTLTSAGEQLLLQVKDISKLEMKSEDGGATGNFATCSQWKDHKAKVFYRLTSDGPAYGEVKSILFE